MTAAGCLSHYDATPVIDIYGAADGADLGYIGTQINKLVAETTQSLARGSKAHLRARADQDNRPSPVGLLAGAIILVYLCIVVNFQSWLDPFIIITALPAASLDRVDAVSHAHPGERTRPHGPSCMG